MGRLRRWQSVAAPRDDIKVYGDQHCAGWEPEPFLDQVADDLDADARCQLIGASEVNPLFSRTSNTPAQTCDRRPWRARTRRTP